MNRRSSNSSPHAITAASPYPGAGFPNSCFEQNQDVLEPMMQALTRLGRLPGPEEFAESAEVIERFGSLKRAFALIRRVTEDQPWDEIAQRRAEDLLVYLALSRFKRRPKLSQLPPSIQRDIKAFLGSYQAACARADVLLFRAGDPQAIDAACQGAEVGQLVDNALIIHRSALDYLQPILRIYEGCARALVGEIDEANVIKLHRFSGKVSYVAYPGFESDPHPALRLRVKVTLPTLSVDLFDYSDWNDPPILRRKERLLSKEHELYQRFARLSRQEEKFGVLCNDSILYRRSHLDLSLSEHGLELRGHCLRRLTADKAREQRIQIVSRHSSPAK
jgi:DNA phosphorothioation-associated putative methyltransferase